MAFLRNMKIKKRQINLRYFNLRFICFFICNMKIRLYYKLCLSLSKYKNELNFWGIYTICHCIYENTLHYLWIHDFYLFCCKFWIFQKIWNKLIIWNLFAFINLAIWNELCYNLCFFSSKIWKRAKLSGDLYFLLLEIWT